MTLQNNPPHWRFAGLWIRVWARLIDCLIIVSINFAMMHYGFGASFKEFISLPNPAHPASVIETKGVIAIVFTVLYEALFISSAWQATPGKRIAGIKVIGRSGVRIGIFRSVVRYVAFFGATFLPALGVVMLMFQFSHTFIRAGIEGPALMLVIMIAGSAGNLINPLFIALNARKRGIHDYIAGTAVVRT